MTLLISLRRIDLEIFLLLNNMFKLLHYSLQLLLVLKCIRPAIYTNLLWMWIWNFVLWNRCVNAAYHVIIELRDYFWIGNRVIIVVDWHLTFFRWKILCVLARVLWRAVKFNLLITVICLTLGPVIWRLVVTRIHFHFLGLVWFLEL